MFSQWPFYSPNSLYVWQVVEILNAMQCVKKYFSNDRSLHQIEIDGAISPARHCAAPESNCDGGGGTSAWYLHIHSWLVNIFNMRHLLRRSLHPPIVARDHCDWFSQWLSITSNLHNGPSIVRRVPVCGCLCNREQRTERKKKFTRSRPEKGFKGGAKLGTQNVHSISWCFLLIKRST